MHIRTPLNQPTLVFYTIINFDDVLKPNSEPDLFLRAGCLASSRGSA